MLCPLTVKGYHTALPTDLVIVLKVALVHVHAVTTLRADA
jgi:hypothetical protein